MPFAEKDGIRYLTFDTLSVAGVTHAVFTRRGGISPAPWKALNVGGVVGDDPQRVAENRQRSFTALGKRLASMYDVWQVHGVEVVCAQSPRPADVPHLEADVILCDQPGVTLFMRFADCVPILLLDPRRGVVGLAHAGWMGTVRRVASAAVQSLHNCYGCQPSDLLAAIGPSIGAHHYPVGPDVVKRVQEAFGEQSEGLLLAQEASGSEVGVALKGEDSLDSGVKFDLWNANRLVLREAGVNSIEVAGICTACFPEDWYSHRGEKGRTGRFGALIGLD
jgi:YfiH family protein